MPKINIVIDTNEIKRSSEKTWGSWTLTIIAGLDEPPEPIIEAALARIRGAIEALPSDKRYSRYGDGAIS